MQGDYDSQPGSPGPSSRRRRYTRVSHACNECRVRKIRGNGRQPCERCEDFERHCTFTSTRGQKLAGAPRTKILEDRLRRARSLLATLQAQNPSAELDAEVNSIFESPPGSPSSDSDTNEVTDDSISAPRIRPELHQNQARHQHEPRPQLQRSRNEVAETNHAPSVRPNNPGHFAYRSQPRSAPSVPTIDPPVSLSMYSSPEMHYTSQMPMWAQSMDVSALAYNSYLAQSTLPYGGGPSQPYQPEPGQFETHVPYTEALSWPVQLPPQAGREQYRRAHRSQPITTQSMTPDDTTAYGHFNSGEDSFR